MELLHTKRSAEYGNEKILHDIMYSSLSQKDNRFFCLVVTGTANECSLGFGSVWWYQAEGGFLEYWVLD